MIKKQKRKLKKDPWSVTNKNKPWTDEELGVVLSDAPTKSNCEKHARIFKRGRGSIELIYRWAMTPIGEIKRKRGGEKFINQIKEISKQIGWVA